MPDLFSKVAEILSNPESAQKIKEIAAGLSDSSVSDPSSESVDDSFSVESSSIPNQGLDSLNLPSGGFSSGGHFRELALLNAMRPYLRSSRAGKIDNAIKAIRVIDFLSALR